MTPEDLRQKRQSLGWTQTRLAQALDLTKRTIIYYETGGKPIPEAVALAMETLLLQHPKVEAGQ